MSRRNRNPARGVMCADSREVDSQWIRPGRRQRRDAHSPGISGRLRDRRERRWQGLRRPCPPIKAVRESEEFGDLVSVARAHAGPALHERRPIVDGSRIASGRGTGPGRAGPAHLRTRLTGGRRLLPELPVESAQMPFRDVLDRAAESDDLPSDPMVGPPAGQAARRPSRPSIRYSSANGVNVATASASPPHVAGVVGMHALEMGVQGALEVQRIDAENSVPARRSTARRRRRRPRATSRRAHEPPSRG